MMALDEHGNPLGGVRNPYVDVPVAKYAPFNTAREPLIENAAEWIIANGGIEGARIMCRLSAYQEPFSREKLRELYGDKHAYLRRVEERLDELEREGWSLPLYRELILRDAAEFWGESRDRSPTAPPIGPRPCRGLARGGPVRGSMGVERRARTRPRAFRLRHALRRSRRSGTRRRGSWRARGRHRSRFDPALVRRPRSRMEACADDARRRHDASGVVHPRDARRRSRDARRLSRRARTSCERMRAAPTVRTSSTRRRLAERHVLGGAGSAPHALPHEPRDRVDRARDERARLRNGAGSLRVAALVGHRAALERLEARLTAVTSLP